jgi:hypothetical protein
MPVTQHPLHRSVSAGLLHTAPALGRDDQTLVRVRVAEMRIEAGRQTMSLPETMAMTGHHSVATVMGYFRAESALDSKASRMLDED